MTRLRRRRCLMCYWHDGAFVAHGYPRLPPTVLHPVAAEILSAFDDWIEPGKAVENLDGLDRESVEQAVVVLRGNGLLLEEGGVEADEDERIARQWGPWAPEASLYHYSTQDEPYTRIDPAPERLDPVVPRRDGAQPGSGSSHAHPVHLLPRRRSPAATPNASTLHRALRPCVVPSADPP